MHLNPRRLIAASGILIVAGNLLFAGPSLMEDIDRGMIAVRSSTTEAFVSWRLLGTDPADVAFNLYRSTGGAPAVQLNAEPITGATNWVDADADFSQSNAYFVRSIVFGLEGDPSEAWTLAAGSPVQQYLRVPLNRPPGGSVPDGNYTYSPNDLSVADLTGDGKYEIIVKWEPSNARDPSQNGFTGNTYFDAYMLDGTQLWRIDSGVNIRAGPHDTPFIVYDFDGDGRAEISLKTGPGTIDGLGNYVADPAKFQGQFPTEPFSHTTDYRNSTGRALAGPEFMTIFDGLTGAELVSTRFKPARHPDTDYETPAQHFDVWGDNFGNRQARIYPPGVAYLDGQRPSVVWGRGYAGGQGGHPGRTAIVAWNWRDGVLTEVWTLDSRGHPDENLLTGQGAHMATVADLTGDGRDDIVYGQLWVSSDGEVLYTGWGHGDALHVSNMDPDRPGQQVFQPHESPSNYGPNALSYVDGKTGELIWGVSASGDIGRGVAADIDPRFPGYEMWGSGGTGGLYSAQQWVPNVVLGPRAVQVSSSKPGQMNHVVWWTDDLLRELLDGTTISKWNWNTNSTNTVLSPGGISSNNGTKSNPGLQVDLFGDWREEVIWRESANEAIRIYMTTIPTEHRIPTLMHDRQYRVQVAQQNVGYNQPPHPSYHLGHHMALPVPMPNIVTSLSVLLGPPAPVFTGVTPDTGLADDDAVTNVGNLVIHGTAQADTTVQITRLGVGVIGTSPADGDGLWSFDYTGTTLAEGDHFLTATATDAEDNTGASTAPPFRITVDTTPPPAPEIQNVAHDSTEDAFIFIGLSEPASAVAVELAGVGALGTAVTDADGGWLLVYDGPMPPAGSLSFTAQATDLAGNTGPLSATFTVDTTITAPTIQGITEDAGISPADGITNDNTLIIFGTAGAGDTVTVSAIGLGSLGSTPVDGSGNWSFDHTATELDDGDYVFVATATDGGGTSPSSPPFLVTIDTAAPSVVSINRLSPLSQNTSVADVVFQVTFSEAVYGIDESDFELTFTGGQSGVITALSADSGMTVDVSVTLDVEGTVRLDVKDGATGITDAAGNTLDGGFTSGQIFNRILTGDGTWIRATSGGLWGDFGNWEDGIIGSGVNNAAFFNTLDLTEDIEIELDSPRSIGNLIFGDTDITTAGSWIIHDDGDSANRLSLAVSAGTPTINVEPLGLDSSVILNVGLGGNSGLSKQGPGMLVLRRPNTVSGSTTIASGILRTEDGAVHQTTSINIVSGGSRLNIAGGQFTATGTTTVNAGGGSALIIDGGTAQFANVQTNNSSGGLIAVNGGVVTMNNVTFPRSSDGNISFASGLVIKGGTTTVNAVNLGTNNSNGVMSVEGGQLTANGNIIIGNQSTSGRGGAMRVIGGTFISNHTAAGVNIVRRANNVSSATFSGGTSYVQRFTLGWTGVNAGNATLTIDGGTVYVGSQGIVGLGNVPKTVNLSDGVLGAIDNWSTSLPITLPADGSIELRAANEADAARTITFDGALSGAGGFTKTGSGSVVLTAANTFTGDVAIDAGTLQVDGSVGGSGAFEINSGGALAGSGAVNRLVNLNDSGTVRPGSAAPASVLNASALTWDGGGKLAYDLGTSRQLGLNGMLAKGSAGTYEVAFEGSSPEPGTFYTLATFASTDFTVLDLSYSGVPGFLGGFLIDGSSLRFVAAPDGPAAHYELWTYLNELPEDQRGFDDNPSGDGIANGLKFYLALDPNATTTEGIVVTTVEVDGETYPAIAFIRREELGGVTGQVLVSPDLGFTADLGSEEISAESQGDGTELVLVRSLVPLSAQADQFFRVTATLPAAE